MSVIIALDVGTKVIGLAKADVRARLATPWQTLSRRGVNKDVAAIHALKAGDEVGAYVVGLPVLPDGSEGRSCRLARQVGEALGALSNKPVHYQDESDTSNEASLLLGEVGYGVAETRRRIDQAAAAIILQQWLDQK